MDEIKILEDLVSFNTVRDKENENIVNYIIDILKSKKFSIKKIEDENGNYSIVATIGKNPVISFLGHMDTVEIGNNWTYNPLKLTIDNNKLIGRGVCDMKSGIAAILSVILSMDLSNLNRGIKLYFTTGEETNFSGINSIVNSDEGFTKYTIICEPTDLTPIVATKGTLSYEAIFNGKAAHSSTPLKGENAIMKAYNFITELMRFYKKIESESNDLFNVKNTTLNIGKINGGTMVNMVPDRCSIDFEFRTISDEISARIKTDVSKLLEKYGCNYKLAIEAGPMICKDETFMKLVESMSSSRKGMSFLTEASFINNTDSIIIGAGPITAHEPNEYIEINKYKDTIKLYGEIIKEICFK